MTSHPPTLHTTAEAAQILRVRQSWLERQAAARRIPFTMLGGSYRFSDDHITQIIRLYEQVPGAEPPSRRRRRTPTRQQHAATTPIVLQPRPRPGPNHHADAA